MYVFNSSSTASDRYQGVIQGIFRTKSYTTSWFWLHFILNWLLLALRDLNILILSCSPHCCSGISTTFLHIWSRNGFVLVRVNWLFSSSTDSIHYTTQTEQISLGYFVFTSLNTSYCYPHVFVWFTPFGTMHIHCILTLSRYYILSFYSFDLCQYSNTRWISYFSMRNNSNITIISNYTTSWWCSIGLLIILFTVIIEQSMGISLPSCNFNKNTTLCHY